MSQLTDKELWDQVGLDSSSAFHVLYNRHWKKIYKTCCHYMRDNTTAEEITHDVFVALWTRRHFLKIENFQNYLHVTARYHVFKFLKAAKINCIEYIDAYQQHNTQLTYNLADQKLEEEDLESKLAEILEGLPARCQEIFWLSRVENLTNTEIAEKLTISKRTVENQITTALKHLRAVYPQSAHSLVSAFFLYALLKY